VIRWSAAILPQTTRRRPDARYILPRRTRFIHFIKFLRFGYRTSMFGSPSTPSTYGKPYCVNAGPNDPSTIAGETGDAPIVQSTIYDRSNGSYFLKPHASRTNPDHDTITYLQFVWNGRRPAKPAGVPWGSITVGRLRRSLDIHSNNFWAQIPRVRPRRR